MKAFVDTIDWKFINMFYAEKKPKTLRNNKEKEVTSTLQKQNFPRKFLLTSADVSLARILSYGQS